jgi:hypothetical protein
VCLNLHVSAQHALKESESRAGILLTHGMFVRAVGDAEASPPTPTGHLRVALPLCILCIGSEPRSPLTALPADQDEGHKRMLLLVHAMYWLHASPPRRCDAPRRGTATATAISLHSGQYQSIGAKLTRPVPSLRLSDSYSVSVSVTGTGTGTSQQATRTSTTPSTLSPPTLTCTPRRRLHSL